MKIEKVFLGLIVMGLLFSCTHEELLRGPDGSKAIDGYVPTTAELTLNMGTIATKADPIYKAATETELSVNKGYVVVFGLEEKDGVKEVQKMIGSPMYFETKASDKVGTDGNDLKIAYKISGIPVLAGKPCRILVIANTTLDLSEVDTYADFFEKIESYTSASDFAANALVKVGYKDVTLSLTNREVEVAMTQLAAKVNITVQMATNWKGSETSTYTWQFEPTSGFTVAHINKKTDLMLIDELTNSQQDNCDLSAPTAKPEEGWSNTFTFYTYEKVDQEDMQSLEITVKGIIHQYKGEELCYSQEEKEYHLTLNETTVNNWNKIRHGNYYDVKANLSPSTMKMEYELTVTPWGDPKAIHLEPYYLYIKDLKLLMPSITTLSTTYNSSPDLDPTNGAQVIRVVELAPDIQTGLVSERELSEADETAIIEQITIGIDPDEKKITIDSPLPDNYIGRRFTIEVTNKKGLTQEVVVDQYPPFYFDSKTTGSPLSGISDQNNPCMYIINTLVTDFRAGLPTTDQIDDLMEYHEWVGAEGKTPNKHDNTYHASPELFRKLATNRLTYLRETAVSGYPLVKTNGTYETINTEENNRRISPRFMLASQAGVTTDMNYTFETSHNRCRNYTEIEKGGETHTDWRVPTLAELYLIDVIQNVKSSSVKAILEGSYYWSGYGVWGAHLNTQSGTSTVEAVGPAIRFMDNRTGNGKTETKTPVRCVRDLK